jgi:hypothetical protein
LLATLVIAGAVGSLAGIFLFREEPVAQGVAVAAEPTSAPTSVPTASQVPRFAAASELPDVLLARRADTDRKTAEALQEAWVPQIASKAHGTVENGRTYVYRDILEEHLSLRSLFPGALLVRSDDFLSFRYGGYWVTVVGEGFATAATANSWCAAHAFARGDCFAKLLSHSHGPNGSTVHR